MCLAVFALDTHPRYRLVVAANRDELHARPAAAAHWWRAHTGALLLGGRDLEAGGTWLGVNRHGRWAFVTNVREPGRHDPAARTRGRLVPDLVEDHASALIAMRRVLVGGAAYNGFNAVVGNDGGAAFGSNRQPRAVALERGVYGVSNASLDTPWPKLVRARECLRGFAAAGDDDPAPLWEFLADRAVAGDALLPDTGVGLARERALSAAFIVGARYGTRASTLLTIDHAGAVWFAERSFDAAGRSTGEVEFRFRIEAPEAAGSSAPDPAGSDVLRADSSRLR